MLQTSLQPRSSPPSLKNGPVRLLICICIFIRYILVYVYFVHFLMTETTSDTMFGQL